MARLLRAHHSGLIKSASRPCSTPLNRSSVILSSTSCTHQVAPEGRRRDGCRHMLQAGAGAGGSLALARTTGLIAQIIDKGRARRRFPKSVVKTLLCEDTSLSCGFEERYRFTTASISPTLRSSPRRRCHSLTSATSSWPDKAMPVDEAARASHEIVPSRPWPAGRRVIS